MPTDGYTKTTLTVIAAALVALVLQNSYSTADAQRLPNNAREPVVQRIAICDPKGKRCTKVQFGRLLVRIDNK